MKGGRGHGRRTVEKLYGILPSVRHYTEAQPTPSAGRQGLRPQESYGEVNSLKSGFSGLPQRGDNTNTSVQVHVNRCTTRNTRKIHKLISSQLSLPQAQVHVCGQNVFALQPSSRCWDTVSCHAHKTGQVEEVLLHTLKHGVEDVLPSGGAVQWNKLEILLISLKGRSNSTNENSQLGCVLHVVALIKSKREGIEI